MSGYDGRPPGWEDPYGQYGAQPDQGYGPPPGQPGYGYGPPGVPQQRGASASTIIVLVLSSLMTLSCCNVLAIPAVITSIIALSRASTDPESSRRLTVWSWALFAGAVVLAIAVFVVLILVGALNDDTSSTSTY
ncbi:hypothetical protein [Actinomadura parmotrematis]|uniref:DUF4190 domain-containing protein n=1 Tax=Actinomadura parmotrematis TaxID=2864039 RepID=A0ABS7FZ30_9ACTN|nr:hypothetical protein [Actinomadura parmotrematis]MBW8485705.1 hypothetical protein [Actinomadura parmotrematis]